MAVYVDDMHEVPLGRFGRMKMSHMIADTTAELFATADKIGLDWRWLQKAGTPHEHFDVSLAKRAEAVKAGAVEITMREVAMKTRAKRQAAAGRHVEIIHDARPEEAP